MDARWKHIESVLDAVLEADPTEWPALAKQACGDDEDLLREVEELLGRVPDIQNFLQTSISETLFEKAAGKPDPLPEKEIHHIERYRIIRELARGGMGRVFLAERADGQFDQQVALKLLHSSLDSEPMRQRFRAERQILASLNHDNIARLFDGGVTGEGRPYIVMEFIEGEPIDQYCDNRQLTINRRLELFTTVCEAVQYAHRKLVVHRDLKPSNIWVTRDGVVKLLDFGIAKVLSPDEQPEDAPHLTQTGLLPLTPAYASPEQIRSQEITTASDVYQLGLVLCELLTGSRPYEVSGKSPGEIEQVICEQPPVRPSALLSKTGFSSKDSDSKNRLLSISRARNTTAPDQLDKQLRGDLDTIIMKALRKEPDRRYDSVEQLGADLKRYLSGRPVEAHPDSWLYRAGKFTQRHKRTLAAAITVLIGVTTLISYYTWQLTQERNTAQLEAQKAEQVSTFLADMFRASNPADSRGETLSARDLLDRGAERIEELASQPEVQASMAILMGNVYLNLGFYNEALPLLEQGLQILSQADLEAQSDMANAHYFTGRVLHDTGDYLESVRHLEKAIEIYRQISDYNSPDYAEALEMMGLIEHVRRNHETGLAMVEESHEIKRNLLGPDHPELAGSWHARGNSKLYIEDLVSAESSFREALRIIRLHQMDHTQQAADILEDLGRILGDQGYFDEAGAFLDEAYHIQHQMYGDDHLYTGLALQLLADLQVQQGDITSAGETYLRALSTIRAAVGEPHPLVARVVQTLGDLNVQKEPPDMNNAEQYYRQAMAMILETLREGHPRAGIIKRKLGSVLGKTARFEEAESLLKRSLEISLLLLHENPGNVPYQRSVTYALEELVTLYEAWDNPEMAEHYSHRHLEMLEN